MVGDLYISVDGTTRIVHPNQAWLVACANELNELGHRASYVTSTVTIHFRRDDAEEDRAMLLLDEVVAKTGGLNLRYDRDLGRYALG